MVERCEFRNLNSTNYGAAIKADNIDSINITDSIFEDNQAAIGGAVYIRKVNQSILSNNQFTRNKADSLDGRINIL